MAPPPLWISSAALSLLRGHPTALTAAAASCCAAALLAGWSQLDCNPALYVRHQWRCQQRTTTSPRANDNNHYFRRKVVWIIGASSGIGEELAYQLSSLPGAGAYECLYLSSRSVDRLDAVAQKCRQLLAQGADDEPEGEANIRRDDVGPAVQVVPLDVTDEASLGEAVRAVNSRSGGFDVVFLNAGRGHLSPATETSAETTRRVVEQTALWPMLVTPMILPHFRRGRTAPHLVVTSSIAAVLPVPLSAVYAASKHALKGYFESLQAENSMRLRVDVICPGPVDTSFHRNGAEAPAPYGSDSPAAKQTLKMPTRRCVELMVSTVTWPSEHGRTVLLCPQPTLSFLYLYPLLPSFLAQRLLRMVGSRRVEMWRKKLDLYDPASWKR